MLEFSLTVSLAPSLYHRSTSPHYNRFTALFPGLPKSVGARRKLHLDFMVLGRITRGRHSDNPGGRHSIQTNQQCTSINPPFLCWMPFLPQPSNSSWLGTGTGICWIAYPHGLYHLPKQINDTKKQ